MIKRIIAALLLVAASASVPAQIPNAVLSARAAGVVGERYDGYLDFASPPTGLVRQQVGAINVKRRALYHNLAARRGVSPAEVAISAGCALLRRVAVGEAYLLSDGVWRRRLAGQPAPRPSYCG